LAGWRRAGGWLAATDWRLSGRQLGGLAEFLEEIFEESFKECFEENFEEIIEEDFEQKFC
jgi:hypothetical protein